MRAVCLRVIGKLGRERVARDNNASSLADRVTRIVLGEMLPFREAILGFTGPRDDSPRDYPYRDAEGVGLSRRYAKRV